MGNQDCLGRCVGVYLDFIFWGDFGFYFLDWVVMQDNSIHRRTRAKVPPGSILHSFRAPPPLLLLLCRAPWCSLVRGELARFVLFARSLDSCVRARIPHGVVWCQHGVVYRGIRISCVDMCRMFYYYYYQGTGRRDEGIGTRQGWRTQGDGCSFTIRVCLHQPSVYITTLALNKRRVL